MNKLLLFLILLFPIYSLSQDSERVLEIERMYSKIIIDEINTECYEVQWKNKNLRAYGRDFCNASECIYSNDNKKITISYFLPKSKYDINLENAITVNYFFNNNNLFFLEMNEIKLIRNQDGREYNPMKPNFIKIKTNIYFKKNGDVEKLIIVNKKFLDGEQISVIEDLVEDEKKIKSKKRKALKYLEIAKEELNKTEDEREKDRKIHKEQDIKNMQKQMENEHIMSEIGEFSLTQAFKDAKALAECACKFQNDFNSNIEFEKCQKIEKELVKKANNAKNKNILYEAEVIFQQLIEDCN